VPKPRPELLVASIIALVDFTAELGATRLVPGSHRWESGRKAEAHEIADAEMPAGSGVVYLGSTVHGAGENSTPDRWRRGIHMSYVLGWLRTEENLYLSTPPEVVKAMPRRTQELMGDARHGGLGSVDMRDPVELLAAGEFW
jgi:ectoine hydroxylase-related dioxygenase (phytanoyl-CoA dioxygenase family)